MACSEASSVSVPAPVPDLTPEQNNPETGLELILEPESQETDTGQEADAGQEAEELTIKETEDVPTEQRPHEERKMVKPEEDKPGQNLSGEVTDDDIFIGTELLGRPTDHSVTVNIVASIELEVYFEYGTEHGTYTDKTVAGEFPGMIPIEVTIDYLQPDTRYYYQMYYRQPGESEFNTGAEHTFHTQRAPGSTFTFAIQGDSHPERRHEHDPDLYARTLHNATSEYPDFYLTIGDDFSIDKLKTVNPDTVTQRYILQRPFLGLVGNSAPIFLVNGNHEQAAAYLLDGTPNNPAVWAQNARNLYYPQPAPDGFYTGNTQPVEFIGLLRNYYSWTWGDALLITIDPYWHSPVPVDNRMGGGDKTRDLWEITIGDTQYQWLKQTLEQSKAKYKFVFAHHVHGTSRGGIDIADLYEWGGKSKNGVWEFDKKRPGWELPIHQLMAKNGVTIFFQGHDHIFVRQELDGITYQTLPEPADPAYAIHNADAYHSGVKLPNSGHLNVTVSTNQIKVDYIQSYLPEDEKEGKENGQVAHSYTISTD